MSKRQVVYDGKTYTVRSDRVEIPNLDSLDRFGALVWLNQNTYATGPRARLNPLAGLGDIVQVKS